MKKSKRFLVGLAFFALNVYGSAVLSATPDEILQQYTAEAKKSDKNFKNFSAENGKKFFLAERSNKKGETVSCAGCHTKDPTKTGKTRAGKAIEPIAVSANKERFTDKAKVEKWFKRNCHDVYERVCTVQEKGDYVSYMKTAK